MSEVTGSEDAGGHTTWDDGIQMRCTCPACPLQFEGTVDGVPAYFRSRWEKWRLGIGGEPVLKPEWQMGGNVEGGEFAAGWMEEDEGRRLIAEGVAEWRAAIARATQPRGGE